MHTRTDKRREIAVALLLIALAAVLRMAQPTLVEFKRDEATVVRLAQAISYEGYLPAVGVDSSLGIDNLPLTLYLMALPLRLWSDPLAAVLATAALNTLAVAATYLLTRAILDRRAAAIAAFLFAVSPWAVLYARKIWCRTLPLFTVALIASLIATLVWKRRWALVGVFISLAALLGLQLEGIVFIPLVGLVLLIYVRELRLRPLLVGLLLCGLLLLPYAIHDARQGWDNLRGLLSYGGGSGTFSWDAVRYAFTMLGSTGIEGEAGAYHEALKRGVLPLWGLNTAMAGLLALALVHAGVQAFRGSTPERRRIFIILLIWFVVPILTQLRPSAATQRHYFVAHYPVQAILIAALLADGLAWIRSRIKKPLGLGIAGAVAALLLIWGGWQLSVIAELRAYMVEHPTTGGYGIPLRYTREAARRAREVAAASDSSAEIIVLSDSTRPFVTETPTVFDALLFGHPHRFTDGRAAIPFPADHVVYLIGPLAPPPTSASDGLQLAYLWLAGLPSLSARDVVTLPDGWSYEILRHNAVASEDIVAGLTPIAAGIPFANNVVFAAYAVDPASPSPGGALSVALTWWLQGPPPAGVDYHFTVQLLDAGGRLVAQDDHAAFPADQWRVGDRVLSLFKLQLPETLAAGDALLRAGMYSYPEITPVMALSPEGQPVDDGVTLQILSIVK